MWKCIGLLLFLGQCIIVTSESSETPGTRNTRNIECCPCPEGRSADLTASATTHFNDDCPCKVRSADSNPAASIFTPIFRAARPPARQLQQNDMKPLLEPEVGLASSVLETLREATEEEYQEALARDAARNALQDDINKLVKIVVNHEPPEADAEPEASNSQTVRCVDPLENNNYLARSSLDYPSIGQTPISDRTGGINEAQNIFYRTLDKSRNAKFSDSLIYQMPLQNRLKTPYLEQDALVSPTHNLNTLVQASEELPITSLLQGRNNLLKQLDLRHILNLDKVTSLVPKEILGGRNIILPDRINNFPSNYPGNVLDETLAESENIENCITADKSINSVGTATTKILNILPTQNNHEIQPKASENSEYKDNIFNKGDGTIEESRDNFKMVLSPDNNGYKTLSSPLDNEYEHPQFKTHQLTTQDKDIPSIKGSILKTLDDFREANAVIHENLKSSLDDVLQLNSARVVSDGDIKTQAVPVTLEPQVWNNKLEQLPRLKYADQDAVLKNSDLNQNQQITNLHPNRETDQRNAESEIKTDIMQKDSPNTDTCLVYGQSKNANSDLSEMKTAASEPSNTRYGFSRMSQNNLENRAKNALNLRVPIKNVEDINLDIFDFQPFSMDQDSTRNTISSLPRLNMKSYKTRVPIPQSLDLKPVKLQKAFRKGNDVLGAVLTIQPHSEGKSNNMVSSQSRSSDNIFNHPLGMLPSFDDLRSFLEHSAKHILKLPHLSKNVGNLDSPLINIEDAADNLRTYTEDTLKNVQQSLGNTLHNVRDRDRTIIGDALLNPNGLVDSLSRNNLDVNEKLHDLHIDLNDRLQRIFDQSRSSSNIRPLNSRYNLYPKNILMQRKQTITDEKLLSNRIYQNRPLSKIPSNRDSNILHRKLNPKTSIQSQRDFDNSRTNLPVRKVNKPITLQNARLSKTVESNPNLQRVFQPKEYKSVPSLITAKKAAILESLTNKKPLLPILEKKIFNPTLSRNTQPERNFLTRNTLTLEQKSSPSESVYNTVPIEETARDSVQVKNIDDKKYKAALPPSFLKKTFLPNIAENNFLSKVKEAVTKDTQVNSNIGDRNDVVPSPSEIIKSAEPPKENIAFNCKMVCDKA
ncbi:uncharacterized protein LOC123710258 [Pieris brassicae]|uniref:uncharacterized protein LOC123710258 n=1 Tax=Pieris brassicae TaxID=7116 RepID=UPI001E65EE33|nr:uncharacterized protein LOC123710258 [Pieris brassicae]